MAIEFKSATVECGDYIQARGTRLYIIDTPMTTRPASIAEFVPATCSYTQVGRIESLGDFGPEASIGSFSPLDSNVICKSMGASDYGELSVTIAKTSDAGLAKLIAAQGTPSTYQFIIVPGGIADPTDAAPSKAFYLNAMVKSARVSVGTGDDIMKITSALVLMGKAYEDFT